MRRSIMCLLICAGAGGCAGTTAYGVSATYGGGAYGYPDMAYVSPGVYAVTNWDVPIFYSNNNYWMYDRGAWYRSPYHTGGWVHGYPPVGVRGIHNPYAYRQYRPSTYYPSYRYPYRYGGQSYPYYGSPRYYGTPRQYDSRRYDSRQYQSPGYRGTQRSYNTPGYRGTPQRSYNTPRSYNAPRSQGTPRSYTPQHSNPSRQYGPRR